jgi:hypothetical protein
MNEQFLCIYCGELTQNCKGHPEMVAPIITDQGFRQDVISRLKRIEEQNTERDEHIVMLQQVYRTIEYKLDRILEILNTPIRIYDGPPPSETDFKPGLTVMETRPAGLTSLVSISDRFASLENTIKLIEQMFSCEVGQGKYNHTLPDGITYTYRMLRYGIKGDNGYAEAAKARLREVVVGTLSQLYASCPTSPARPKLYWRYSWKIEEETRSEDMHIIRVRIVIPSADWSKVKISDDGDKPIMIGETSG